MQVVKLKEYIVNPGLTWNKPYFAVKTAAGYILMNDNGFVSLRNPVLFEKFYEEDAFYIGDILTRKDVFLTGFFRDKENHKFTISKCELNAGAKAEKVKSNSVGGAFFIRLKEQQDKEKKYLPGRFDLQCRGFQKLYDEAQKAPVAGFIAVHKNTGAAYFVKNVNFQSGTISLEGHKGTWKIKSFEFIPNIQLSLEMLVNQEKPAPAVVVPPKPVFTVNDPELVKQLDKVARGNVCSYAFRMGDGKAVYRPAAACHAGLGYEHRGKIISLATNLGHHYKEQIEDDVKDAYLMYVEYIMKESPWKHCFVEGQNPKEVIKSSVLMDVTQNHNEVVSACIAIRVGHEHIPHIVLKVFKDLVDKGFSKNVAFLVCHSVTMDGEALIPREHSGWHHCMSSHHLMENYKSLFSKGFKKLNNFKTQDGLVKYQIQDLIGTEEHGAKAKTLINTLASSKGISVKEGGWGARIYSQNLKYDNAIVEFGKVVEEALK